nr:MAG TPA: hypothetical protein [Caudoviricetes sp.]
MCFTFVQKFYFGYKNGHVVKRSHFLYLLKLFSHLLVIWSGASVMMLMMM